MALIVTSHHSKDNSEFKLSYARTTQS